MSTAHSSLSGTNLHEIAHYVASSDPGAVGAGKYWLDTTSTPYILKRRNGTDDGWITIGETGTIGGSSGSTDNAITRADGTGGATIQNSLATIDDSGSVNIPSGQTYKINNAAHTHAAAVAQAIFSVEGALTTGAKALRIYNKTGASKTISQVFLAVNTAPTGAAIIVDIHKDGTTIFTTQSNRPDVDASANTGYSTTIEVATWADGEYLTLEIDQIGSGTAGADLTVHVVYS